MATSPKFIVAEISKNWPYSENPPIADLLSQRFELLENIWWQIRLEYRS